MASRLRLVLFCLLASTIVPTTAKSASSAAAPINKQTKQASKQETKQSSRSPASVAFAQPPTTAPKAVDPNAAVEIRGQSRTLSMMLVLKNGKDEINFIKVRKDYKPEISRTQY